MSYLAEINEFEEAITSGKTVIVDFWAPWCRPCVSLKPELEELQQDFPEQVFFANVTEEWAQKVAKELGIKGIPSVITFKDGVELSRLSGAYPIAKYKESLSQ